MNDSKPWYMSKGTVAPIIGILVMVFAVFFPSVTQDEAQAVGESIEVAWYHIVATVAMIVGLYGRIKAKKAVTL
ncbi:MAG: hypothetical protein AAF432_00330 [Planctomycetota bacterium]